ncbi:MAG: hypothetical protein KGV59_07660 [Tenacibaculum sp.]|nr:hypothetical protein [Tenacibaculum sp.]
MRKIIMLFTVILLVSCIGQKKVIKQNHELKTTTETVLKKDSSKVVDRSLAIKDNMLLSLKTNDKKIDSLIRQRLKGFSTEKTSGKNHYTAKFDYDRLALSIASVIGETKSVVTDKNIEKDTKQETEEQNTEYFFKKITTIPWWLWGLISFWLLPQIIERLKFFLSPIKTLFKNGLKSD